MDGTGEPAVAGRPPVSTALELSAEGLTWHATPDRAWTVGRAVDADIHLRNPRISRDHATLHATPDGWVLTNHSRNGVYHEGHRVERLLVRQPLAVWLGSRSEGVVMHLRPHLPANEGTGSQPT